MLQDPSGCLTEAGRRALADAPVGKAPQQLAAHVASCLRCQELVLLAGAPRPLTRRKAPPPWRVFVVVGAAVLLLLSILVTLRRLR